MPSTWREGDINYHPVTFGPPTPPAVAAPSNEALAVEIRALNSTISNGMSQIAHWQREHDRSDSRTFDAIRATLERLNTNTAVQQERLEDLDQSLSRRFGGAAGVGGGIGMVLGVAINLVLNALGLLPYKPPGP